MGGALELPFLLYGAIHGGWIEPESVVPAAFFLPSQLETRYVSQAELKADDPFRRSLKMANHTEQGCYPSMKRILTTWVMALLLGCVLQGAAHAAALQCNASKGKTACSAKQVADLNAAVASADACINLF
jgi:hypothetical protein